ncbi:MAG: hypothetical protein HC788_11425, partial [Sphingopyxis sp.]|nr:hypothetical protein [Sphingopyxis sp.]
KSGSAKLTMRKPLHIYGAGLPNPGAPQFSIVGPVLTEGVINEFDISQFPGNKSSTREPSPSRSSSPTARASSTPRPPANNPRRKSVSGFSDRRAARCR